MFLDLKLGNICNLKCRICGSWSSNKWAQEEVQQNPKHIAKKWLKDGQWPRKNPQFWENVDKLLPDIKYFEFTGGEPLVRKGIDKIINKSVENNLMISLTTNGWHVKRYLNELKKTDLLDKNSIKKITNAFSKNKKSEVMTLSTVEKSSISKIKSKLLSYVY